jgi:Fur family zinc uptake transcriptional regulator
MSNKNHQKCISRIKKRQIKIDSAHEKNIFDLLIKGHKAMSAYQIIDAYSKNYGQVLKPMQVYRVLKKLTEKHLIHRINYNNSYVACFNENDHEAFVGFICNKCSTIEEKTQEPVKELTKKFGLSKNHISQTNLEIVGTCQNCL